MKKKTANLIIGRQGEAIAKSYLQSKGYDIIEQNYKTKYWEIDLIARDRRVVVFIEVRTKVGERFGSPEESLSRNKINRLIKSALAYTAQRGYAKQYRIDAICIVLDESRELNRISHYQNITSAGLP